MDLTMRVQLHYGKSPVRGDTDSMQQSLDTKSEYCAVYVRNDVPSQVHDVFTTQMIALYGVHSGFGKREGDYIKPFLINDQGVATATLEGSHAGGIFFSDKLANTVARALEARGYKIEKMYDKPEARTNGRFAFVPLVEGIVGGKEPQ